MVHPKSTARDCFSRSYSPGEGRLQGSSASAFVANQGAVPKHLPLANASGPFRLPISTVIGCILILVYQPVP